MSEAELDRQVRRRLAVLRHVEEVTGNVAMTCRYFGISRQTYYGWLRRYETEGVDGLRDRSKRPRTSPNATRAEVVEKIIHLRRNYHFGPAKIVMYLKRYHDVEISKSGVWRILDRLDMGKLPTSQRYKRHDRRWKRYEKQRPGHRVQIDVQFVEPLPKAKAKPEDRPELAPARRRKKFYQYTAIDDCTRLRIMKIYPRNNQKTAIQFLDYVLSQLPFPVETIQTQRRRVRHQLPLARAGQGHRPHLHQTPNTPTQRQSRTLPPHRRRRVLPPPRRRRHRHQHLQHPPQGMAGLLQLRPPPRRPRRPNAL